MPGDANMPSAIDALLAYDVTCYAMWEASESIAFTKFNIIILRHLHRHIATEKVDNLIKSGLVHSLCLCCVVCMYMGNVLAQCTCKMYFQNVILNI